MRRHLLRGICFLLVGLAAAFTAEAQETAAAPAADAATAPWRIGLFVGAAHNSPTTQFLGSIPGRDHLFVGFEALTPVLRVGQLRLAYAAQLLPVVLVRGRTAPLYYVGSVQPDGTLPGPNMVYAYGVSPFGLEAALPLSTAVSAYAAAAAGGLVFTRPFPVPEAQRTNFTLEFGGGLLVHMAHERWLKVGYKFHHLSNAYNAQVNPGLDAKVFLVGYQWTTRLAR